MLSSHLGAGRLLQTGRGHPGARFFGPTTVGNCPDAPRTRRSRAALHVAVEGGAEYQRENEPDPIVHRDVAVQSLSRLDPLKGRDRRPGTTTIAPGTGRVSTSWN